MTPFLVGMRGSLTTKKVVADMSGKLCESVAVLSDGNVSISLVNNYSAFI